MLPAVVVIDLEPTPSIEAAAVLVDRCSQVVASGGSGGCELRDVPVTEEPTATASQPEPPWLVRVTWSGETLHSAQIVLLRGENPTEVVRRRELSFSDASPEQDRWESVGLLVAALVVSSRAPLAPVVEPSPAEPVPSPPAKPEGVPPRALPPRAHWGVAGLVGSALSDAPPEFGIKLMVDIDFPSASVRPLLQLSYGHTSDSPQLHNPGLALGLGAPWRGTDLELEAYATALGQLVHARASQSGRSQSASRWRWGGALGLNAFARLNPTWSIWLGAEAVLLTPRVVFELHNQPAGELGTVGGRGFLGVRGTL
jgi:hypothetical protein